MAEPTVSVVTPSYEQRDFVEDTLDSVANQNYPEVEHIVVDGGSDDGTVALLEEYGDQYDHLRWISEPDDGQADAVNKGLDMAEGTVVGWLNSDDVYVDTSVMSRVVRHFERTGADAIYGDIALLNPNSDVIKLHLTPSFDYGKLLRYCFVDQPALFLQAGALDGERLDTSLDYVMDYELWLRLARDHDFRHVADVLAGDRNHPDRKILRDRETMQEESKEVAGRYGRPAGMVYRLGRIHDVTTSGVPRRLQSLRRTIAFHRHSPNLAFEGALRPLPEMLANVFRQNRTLV